MTTEFNQAVAAVTKVPLGTTSQTKLIARSDVAEGTTGRLVPLYNDVVCVGCFFSENPKGVFLCTQEEALSIGQSPRYYYVIPGFRLNTDSKGVVKEGDTSLKLEYLRLSETQYDKVAMAFSEQESITSFALTKVRKSAEGRDFSYVEPTVSNKKLPQSVLDKIDEVRKSLNEDQIWKFIISDIARPFKDYLRAINGEGTPAIAERQPQSSLQSPTIRETFDDDTDEFEQTEFPD